MIKCVKKWNRMKQFVQTSIAYDQCEPYLHICSNERVFSAEESMSRNISEDDVLAAFRKSVLCQGWTFM